ncbi:MAG: rod shape-determining protein RodA [Bacteroidia bacterium]
MSNQKKLFVGIDKQIVGLYAILVFMGWLNIYAAVYNEEHANILDISQSYGRQLMWIVGAVALATFILLVDGNFFTTFAYPIYGFFLFLLIITLAYTSATNGANSWFNIGPFKVQPSEFAKFATALALAKYLSQVGIRMQDASTRIISAVIIGIPAVLILMQNDTGSTLVFAAFILVLYREGLSGNILLLGVLAAFLFVLALLFDKVILISIIGVLCALAFIPMRKRWKDFFLVAGIFVLCSGMIFSVDYVFNKVLQQHQRNRINVLLGKLEDKKGVGYNVNQSLIAFGSGGFSGKGYLQGTQTKYNFVPEQSTDFIFCTVGEEWGFVGCTVVIATFVLLLIAIILSAERQRSTFTRVYGYAVASILFIHMFINIGMAIGLAPVIGIPLPFFSYGGSSLWAFTILLFIYVKLDAHRLQSMR